MTLQDALATLLMGRDAWDGYGGRPLRDAPDSILRAARSFFRDRNAEIPSRRLQEQCDAITIVLEHRDRTGPQQRLPL